MQVKAKDTRPTNQSIRYRPSVRSLMRLGLREWVIKTSGIGWKNPRMCKDSLLKSPKSSGMGGEEPQGGIRRPNQGMESPTSPVDKGCIGQV